MDFKDAKAYRNRNRELRKLGFNSYAEYLASELWSNIRAKVLRDKGRKCFCCGARADTVHHQTYHVSVLNGKDRRPLQPVCDGCHRRIEFDESGGKRPLHEVHRAARRLKASYRHGKPA